jgi:hypothetical protein
MKASVLLPTCVVIASGSTDRAWAQSNDSGQAEALFNTAMRLRDARMYDEACPKFAESNRLAPGVGVRLHLADCYEHLGRKASAWREFREAEKMAVARQDKRADVARAHAAALEPQLNRITIVPPPTEGTPGAGDVLVDGEPLPPEGWSNGLAVDPGDHTVTVNSPGHPPQTFSARVAANALVTTVNIAPIAAEPPPASAISPPALSTSPAPPAVGSDANVTAGRPPGYWIGAELIGAGLIGIGVGGALVPIYEKTPVCDGQMKTGSWAPSIIAFSAGAVALGVGLVVHLKALKKKQEGIAVVVAPTPLPGGGGAALEAGF